MPDEIDQLLTPPSEVADRALAVARRWCTPAVVNHCIRSWVWAALLGESERIEFDAELLFVSAMLHDLGVGEPFDSHSVPFETAGGAVAWAFAAGADWSEHRRGRVMEVIERHMWVDVDPAQDAEGYLLEAATSLDVAAAGAERWDADLIRAVTSRVPRLAFSTEFAAAIHDQAARKPQSTAHRLDGSGRIAAGDAAWQTMLGR